MFESSLVQGFCLFDSHLCPVLSAKAGPVCVLNIEAKDGGMKTQLETVKKLM